MRLLSVFGRFLCIQLFQIFPAISYLSLLLEYAYSCHFIQCMWKYLSYSRVSSLILFSLLDSQRDVFVPDRVLGDIVFGTSVCLSVVKL